VPGWYGVGTALKTARESGAGETLKQMYTEWHFFKNFISNVEMTLAKTDMNVAAHYVENLVPDELHRIFEDIKEEFVRTVEEIKLITEDYSLLEHNQPLAATLQVRDFYLLPLQFLQVSLLKRIRAKRITDAENDPELSRALSLTINGIANGLRNTG
jgi:phosphoenolpyruvate carboxylase